MAWLLNEDKAIKEKLKGITVEDTNAPPEGRPVAVRYRWPETEFAKLSFPLVVIDQTGASIDHEREHRGHIELPYSPEGFPEVVNAETNEGHTGYFSEFPTPYNIDYQISVLSRTAQHDVYLKSILAQTDYLPARFGYLEIPEDGTIRRLDLIGGPESSWQTDTDGKRLFTSIYAVRISSELLPSQVKQYTDAITFNVTVDSLPVEYSQD